jgi:hypothetical protein
MPIGIILDLMQVIRFEVQQGTIEQAQAWVDECIQYADERGWDLRWFNTMYIAWLLIDCHINYIRMIQSYFGASHPNNNVRHLHITNVNPPKLTKLNIGIVQRRPRLPIVQSICYLLNWPYWTTEPTHVYLPRNLYVYV